ncbi:copper-exporting ATPase [Diplogelasinospora grovesii]|uniref:Copper-exporting ATPase n=1 Tax=Diplogelasinospora grovesii TaxID=303347 RepID=A0AAN6N6D6_9PEZI|nr:copper-exporting ATPase [Diplogelasinospora grovesii]
MAPSNRRGPLAPAAETVTTSFLLANLHCPTCVSTIKGVLQESCAGHVRWVSPNVVTSVVTVEHDPAASIREMHKALEESGFEVCGVTTSAGEVSDLDLVDHSMVATYDNGEGSSGSSRARHNNSQDNLVSPTSALTRWITSSRLPSRSQIAQSEQAKAHLLNCEQCRNAKHHGSDEKRPCKNTSPAPGPTTLDTTVQSGPRPKMSSKSFITIETDEVSSSPQPLWRVTLAVGGMTCAVCVNNITKELGKLDWVANCTVNLLTNSATIDIRDENRANDVVEAIEDLGYEATLDTVVNLNQEKPKKAQESSDTWRATLAIGGMTCAACANNITKEVKKKDWIKNIAVNLVTNSATAEFQGRDNAEKLVEAIEDLGYEASLDTVVDIAAEQPEDHERTAEIMIEGLYCEHCPSRVTNSLAGFRRQLDVISQPSRQRPIIKITYVPDAPAFTIRQILAAIEASDPAFRASIYHPPTLEERSKQIMRQHQKQILWRVILTGIICIPTFIIGIVYMSLVPSSDHTKMFMMEPWTSGISRAQMAMFIMASPVYFFAADIFHVRALKEIRTLWRRSSRVPILQRFYRFGSMNTLMSLGTTIAYVSSVSQLIAAAVHQPTETISDSNFYFDSVVFLTFFLLVGRLIESYSKSRTGDAVELLGKLRPTTAILVERTTEDGYEKGIIEEKDTVVKADMLDFGDIVRVTHGTSPPADGRVVQGESNFDESSLTGESRLVKKVVGDEVFSGTFNKDAPILVRITGANGQSMLDQIVNVVREGQTKRAPMEQIADLLTTYFVPVVTLIAILTWLIWLSLGLGGRIPGHFLDVTSGGWVAFSLQFAIAVFVVACPCGLALAAPTAIFVGGGIAAKHGILAKGGGEAFEKASRIDCVVFDKTGTLTMGGAQPCITDSETYLVPGVDEGTVLAALKAVEENSSHPIAKAIVSFCTTSLEQGEGGKGVLGNLRELPGQGMRATYKPAADSNDEFILIVGNENMMEAHQVHIPGEVKETLEKWKNEAKSVALVAITPTQGGQWVGFGVWTLAAALSISDPIRPEAPHIINALQQRGTQVWMLSGDNPTTANAVARQLGIPGDQVIAGVLPTQKAEKISYLQKTLKSRTNKFGRVTESATQRAMIAMVGDGINDSPALAVADVGVAIGSGSDVAISSADFVLVKSDLRAVVTLLDLSATVFRRIKFNFGWALIYNVIAIPVAAGAFYPIVSNGSHVRLDPVWASLAMALSSISVVLSSLALRSEIPGLGFRERKLQLSMNATVKRKFNALLQGIGSRPFTSYSSPDDRPTSRDAASVHSLDLEPTSPSPSRMAAESDLKKRRVGATPTTTKYGSLQNDATPTKGATTISNITLRKWTPTGTGSVVASAGGATPTKSVVQQPLKYCPSDRDALLRRLGTFQELTDWTPKPDRVNEVEWAKRGWACTGKERVKCTLCARELVVKLNRKEVDGKEIAVLIASEIEAAVVDKYLELIVTAHSEECLWRKKGCDDSLLRLPLANPKTALEGLRQRYDELLERRDFLPYEFNLRLPSSLDIDAILSFLPPTFFTDPPPKKPLPSHPADSSKRPPNRTALALAVLGWQGLSSSRIGPVPNSASCHTCLRRLGLWMFKSKEIDPETNEILVPAPMDHLDPLREHRFFCPWKNPAAQRNPGARPLQKGEEDKAGWEILVQVLRNEAYLRQRANLVHSRSKSSITPAQTRAETPVRTGTPLRPMTSIGTHDGNGKGGAGEEEEDEETRKKKDQHMMSRLRRGMCTYDIGQLMR